MTKNKEHEFTVGDKVIVKPYGSVGTIVDITHFQDNLAVAYIRLSSGASIITSMTEMLEPYREPNE